MGLLNVIDLVLGSVKVSTSDSRKRRMPGLHNGDLGMTTGTTEKQNIALVSKAGRNNTVWRVGGRMSEAQAFFATHLCVWNCIKQRVKL